MYNFRHINLTGNFLFSGRCISINRVDHLTHHVYHQNYKDSYLSLFLILFCPLSSHYSTPEDLAYSILFQGILLDWKGKNTNKLFLKIRGHHHITGKFVALRMMFVTKLWIFIFVSNFNYVLYSINLRFKFRGFNLLDNWSGYIFDLQCTVR